MYINELIRAVGVLNVVQADERHTYLAELSRHVREEINSARARPLRYRVIRLKLTAFFTKINAYPSCSQNTSPLSSLCSHYLYFSIYAKKSQGERKMSGKEKAKERKNKNSFKIGFM